MHKQPADAVAREQAIDINRSFIVQAPAGSGKTELLTQRILCLLSVADEPEDILAITFTRKATAEMRTRILEALLLASNSTPEAQTDPLLKQRCELAKEVLKRDQIKAWGLLKNPSRLRIHTIDAFNASLTRQLPVLSQFGAQPLIVDNADNLYRQSVRHVLNGKHMDFSDYQAVLSTLAHYGYNFTLLEDALVSMLARRDQWQHVLGLEEADRQILEGLLIEMVEQQLQTLKKISPSIWDELLRLAHFAIQQAHLLGRSCRFECLAEYAELPTFTADHLLAWQALLELLLTQNNTVRKQVRVTDGFPTDAKLEKAAMLSILSELQLLAEWLPVAVMVRTLPVPRYADQQWQTLAPLLHTLKLCLAELTTEFSRSSQVDHIEMAQRAQQSLVHAESFDSDAPSELALLLDHRIVHILVDEFQDTSSGQQRLLQSLLNGWQPNDGRTVFLVGDPMQSIYRFRKAEVGIYLNIWLNGLVDVEISQLRLNTNFRSQGGLVKWVNQAFSEIFPSQDDIDTNAVSYSMADGWHEAMHVPAVKSYVFSEKSIQDEADRVVSIVQRVLQVEDPSHDVAILVRNRRQAKIITSTLLRNRIAFSAIDMSSLDSAPEVRDLQALTQAFTHPADHHSWLSVFRAPWCGLTLPDLLILTEQANGMAMLDVDIQQLSTDGQIRFVRVQKILKLMLLKRKQYSLSDCIEVGWRQLGGHCCYPDSMVGNNCERFFGILQDLEKAAQLDDPAFLQVELKRAFALPDTRPEASRVKLMTIHKAKGLEFSEVILPGCGESTTGRADSSPIILEEHADKYGLNVMLGIKKPASSLEPDPIHRFMQYIQSQRERHENQRVLYVAVTRARRQLHILGHIGQNGKPSRHSPLEWLQPYLSGNILGVSQSHVADEEKQPTLQRLPIDWQPVEALQTLTESNDEYALETAHADTAARQQFEVEDVLNYTTPHARVIGVVVHSALQLIAEQGLNWWQKLNQANWVKQQLKQQSINPSKMAESNRAVLTAIDRTLDDETGRWLLGDHAESYCEYALNSWVNGALLTAVVDRTFVDQGTRWIIDYKTATYSEASEEVAFIKNLKGQYQQQLQRYSEYFKKLENRPIKTAIYLPMLARLVTMD